jgi:mRNA interferase MazF
MEIAAGDIVLCKFYFSDAKKSKNRPVLVLKDNLPFDDFVAIPISSQISNRHSDEVLLETKDFLQGSIPKTSKVMLRKTFVVSKQVVIKRYGTLTNESFNKYKQLFCQFFDCC